MTEAIPFIDLTEQFETIRPEVEAAVAEVFRSQQFILGSTVANFEAAVEQAFDLPKGAAIGVSSGTDALLVSLMAAGIGPGDRVLTTPFSFFATAGVIARLGATPVFVDIDPETFNISLAALSAFDPDDFRALIVVHIFGRLMDMDAIKRWKGAANTFIVEDAAQAIGCRFADGRAAGMLGDLGCFSFFPTKNLGGAGDGGMVTAQDAERADLVRKLRVHGASRQYESEIIGGNFRLDALQAAVLQVKLKSLASYNAARLANAKRYDDALGALGPDLKLPGFSAAGDWNAHQYVLRSGRRDRLRQHLQDRGIATAIYYPKPFHLLESFRSLGYQEGDFPAAEKACSEALALPIFPELNAERQGRIIAALKDFHQV